MVNRSLQRLDWIVLLATLAIAVIGLTYLWSASPASFARQIQWLVLGLAVMTVMLVIPYQRLLAHAYEIYLGGLSLLLLVLALPPTRGAHSWITVPGLPINIQPSEIMKLCLILILARHLMRKETQTTLKGLITPFALTLLPMALILKQPDLGTGILLPPLLFCIVFASGARLWHLLDIGACGLLSAVPMWLYVLKAYQKRRILAFLDPERYEADEAYQLLISLRAIGSGGIFGQGLGNGTQNSLDLLPDKHTDFIFGVIAEEGGLVVGAMLLGLYLLLVCAGLHIARKTREPGGRLIAAGVSSILGIQVLINIGVVTVLLPTTGITLPLASYGGSSLMVTFAMIGLLLNVGASRPIVIERESFTGEVPE